MPLYVRRLPCSQGLMIDEKQIPPNTALYNPSKASKYTYIRQTEHTPAADMNSMIIHHEDTGKIVHIDSPYAKMNKTVNLFKGLEDLRLCEYNGKIWFGATSTHVSESMNNELVIGYFNQAVTEIEYFEMVDIGSHPVKNVIPFVHQGKLLLLDIYLRKIYNLDDETDPTRKKKWKISIYKELTPAHSVSTEKYRGSTGPIHLHGSIYGCVVHDIIFNDNTKLVTRLSYIHHWYEFDIDTGLVTFISTSFWVAHWGIEYISGIYKEKDGKIALFIGVNDKLPVKALTSLSDLRVGK
jgi:hypothetical protein